MSQLERHIRDCRKSSYFLRFASDVTSQCGEDGIIEELFKYLPKTSDDRRFCVEIGAWDGKHLSNTYNLLYNQSSWDGILIEANTQRVAEMKTLYQDKVKLYEDSREQYLSHVSSAIPRQSVKRIECVEALVAFEGGNSLANLLSRYNAPINFDFLSIDVDGNDYHIWASLSSNHCDLCDPMTRPCLHQYRPSVVCIEFNPTIPNDIVFVQERNMRIQQGSSLRALVNLGNQMKYTFIVATTFNAFFVRDELVQYLPQEFSETLRDSEDYIDRLHAASMSTMMFQTYDGEIKLVGPKKLLWHRKAINPQSFQVLQYEQALLLTWIFNPKGIKSVLSKHERIFPFAPPYDDKLADMNNSFSTLVQYLLCIASSADQNESKLSSPSTRADGSIMLMNLKHLTAKVINGCHSLLSVSHLEGIIEQMIAQLAYVTIFLASAVFAYVQSQIHENLHHQGDISTIQSVEDLMERVFGIHGRISIALAASRYPTDEFILQTVYALSLILHRRGLSLQKTSPHRSKQFFHKAVSLLELCEFFVISDYDDSSASNSKSKRDGDRIVTWDGIDAYDESTCLEGNIRRLCAAMNKQIMSTMTTALIDSDESGLEACYWAIHHIQKLETVTNESHHDPLSGHRALTSDPTMSISKKEDRRSLVKKIKNNILKYLDRLHYSQAVVKKEMIAMLNEEATGDELRSCDMSDKMIREKLVVNLFKSYEKVYIDTSPYEKGTMTTAGKSSDDLQSVDDLSLESRGGRRDIAWIPSWSQDPYQISIATAFISFGLGITLGIVIRSNLRD